MISGCATVEATTRYAKRFTHLSYTPLFPGGSCVSQAGFGTYRVAAGIPDHAQALEHALRQGINLIDTSSNYGDGEAEKLIAAVVGRAVDRGELSRESVVVVSKAGYIQGRNLETAEVRKQEGRPFPNIVKYAEGLDHCIHPDFLEDQLTRSLGRLQMSSLDGLLLHNPEYYLMWSEKWRRPLAEARQTYYERIQMAFNHLEEEVARGRIGWYGISSNTFPSAADEPGFTSLERVWEIAQSISPNHHFRAIQFPFNLLETGAVTERNQSDNRSVMTFARQAGLATLINRPLNAIQGSTLTRLADPIPPSYPTTPPEVSTAVDTLVETELHFQQDLLPRLDIDKELHRPLLEQLAIGRILQGHWRGFGSHQNWVDIQSRYLIPRAQLGLKTLSNSANLPPEASEWMKRYVDAVDITSAAVGAFYREEGVRQAKTIKERAAAADPAWVTPRLSQTALRALRSTGATAILVGMRHEGYVDDVLAELERPSPPAASPAAWESMRSAA